MKNQKGFTLIEMLVVMMIISILLLIFVPSVTKNRTVVQEKSCEATQKILQTQVMAYQIEKNVMPSSLEQLKTEGYITSESMTCSDGRVLVLNGDKIEVQAASDSDSVTEEGETSNEDGT